MNKLIGKPESKLFMGMAMSSVPRVARAESSVRVNDGAGLVTGGPESQQHTGSQIIRICMEIYLKINKTVKMYKNSY